MNTLRTIRVAVWGLVVLAVVATGAILGYRWFAPPPVGEAAVSIGGPFQLVDQTGAPITEAALRGHPSLMFFGYTYCPDVCPTALADVTAWMKTLGGDADRVKVYFVTVDPERDTQAQMASYLGSFDPRITGITGPQDRVEAMLKAFRVYYRKVPVENSAGYLMDHAASFYLLDANAALVGTLNYNETQDEAVARIRRLIAES